MEGTIKIKVKYLSEKNFEVDVESGDTILALKEKCSPHLDNCPAEDMK